MYTQYLKEENGTIRFSGPIEKLSKIDPNVYYAHQDDFGNLFLDTMDIKTDGIIELENSPAQVINKKVDEFLDEKVRKAFDRYKILYKRGLLMYGPPGTGKTSIIHLLIKTAIEKDIVVLLNTKPYLISEVVHSIRLVEKSNRPIMVVWEEFENYMNRYEGDLLNLLDGMTQTDNIFYVATTNYLDRIPERLRNRPSRFAEVLEIGPPDANLRREFLKAKLHPEDDIDMDLWVEKSEGLTIDHLKDLIISVLVLDLSLDDAVTKLNNLGKDVSAKETKKDSGEIDFPIALLSTEAKVPTR